MFDSKENCDFVKNSENKNCDFVNLYRNLAYRASKNEETLGHQTPVLYGGYCSMSRDALKGWESDKIIQNDSVKITGKINFSENSR